MANIIFFHHTTLHVSFDHSMALLCSDHLLNRCLKELGRQIFLKALAKSVRHDEPPPSAKFAMKLYLRPQGCYKRPAPRWALPCPSFVSTHNGRGYMSHRPALPRTTLASPPSCPALVSLRGLWSAKGPQLKPRDKDIIAASAGGKPIKSLKIERAPHLDVAKCGDCAVPRSETEKTFMMGMEESLGSLRCCRSNRPLALMLKANCIILHQNVIKQCFPECGGNSKPTLSSHTNPFFILP